MAILNTGVRSSSAVASLLVEFMHWSHRWIWTETLAQAWLLAAFLS